MKSGPLGNFATNNLSFQAHKRNQELYGALNLSHVCRNKKIRFQNNYLWDTSVIPMTTHNPRPILAYNVLSQYIHNHVVITFNFKLALDRSVGSSACECIIREQVVSTHVHFGARQNDRILARNQVDSAQPIQTIRRNPFGAIFNFIPL